MSVNGNERLGRWMRGERLTVVAGGGEGEGGVEGEVFLLCGEEVDFLSGGEILVD